MAEIIGLKSTSVILGKKMQKARHSHIIDALIIKIGRFVEPSIAYSWTFSKWKSGYKCLSERKCNFRIEEFKRDSETEEVKHS